MSNKIWFITGASAESTVVLANLLGANGQDQIAPSIELQALHPGIGQADYARVCAWLKHQIVFKVLRISIEDHVGSGVNIVVTNFSEERNVVSPGAGIVPEEVIRAPGESVFRLDGGSPIASFKPNAKNAPFRAEHDFVLGQPERGRGSVREIANALVSLTKIGFEDKGNRRSVHKLHEWQKQKPNSHVAC